MRWLLVNVLPQPDLKQHDETAITDAMNKLNELVPADARLWCRSSVIVEHGEAADRILETAAERKADIIVLGIRDAAGRLGTATHLDRPTAHKVIAHARCPVLTVSG